MNAEKTRYEVTVCDPTTQLEVCVVVVARSGQEADAIATDFVMRGREEMLRATESMR